MVSVETKTFENGVMRMVGISTYDCISVIFYQSAVFRENLHNFLAKLESVVIPYFWQKQLMILPKLPTKFRIIRGHYVKPSCAKNYGGMRNQC